MGKLNVNLEHCYGIKKLKHEFDFSDGQTLVIYARNGVMKTSFAKTFDDIGNGRQPHDQMDNQAHSVYDISDDSGTQISPERIFVIHPYDIKAFDSEGKVLTLLADENMKAEYLEIYKELESTKGSLIKNLKGISRSTNCEAELMATFSFQEKSIFEIFTEIIDDVKNSLENFEFRYNDVFDSTGKVKVFLAENQILFNEYCSKYEDLISKSEFFSKGKDHIFGTTEAKGIKASIDGNEFFVAGHKLNLKKYGEIANKDRFNEILTDEINKVFGDENLKQVFDKIDQKLDANKELKAFKKVIEKDPSLLVRLNDYELFRKEVWFSYLKLILAEITNLVDLYLEKKPKLESLVKRANDQKSKWEEAIEEFHNRFVNLPFVLSIDNKADAILNIQAPVISFKFEGKPVERKELLEILSQGEKRAFYLLNVIFGIRARGANSQQTIFIIDDIADSFDYQNKYAIIEYLNDLTKNVSFCSIILTHNFDFYRTIASRLGIHRKNKLHAIKIGQIVKIVEEVYQNPPFQTWRENLESGKYYDKSYSDIDAKKHILALIPFVRNLIEYGGRRSSSTSHGDDYDTLTCLLHSKGETKKITFGDLRRIYKEHLNKDNFDSTVKDTDGVYDQVLNVASANCTGEFNLENKIVLAMAVRHKAEEYMWSKVTDQNPISGAQTGKLFQRYQGQFLADPSHLKALKVLESVNIMTPENIHINSFMYEPILDMSTEELIKLYDQVCGM